MTGSRGRGQAFDQVGGADVAGRRLQLLCHHAMPRLQVGVGEQPPDRVGQLLVIEPVRVQPHAVAQLVHALRVVVLIPEQRQHDHRLAEVEALGHGVVAAVRDDHVDLRQDRRLRQELLAEHVVGERQQFVLRPLADDHAVVGGAQDVDQALHQLDVGRSERAERQVDERCSAGERGVHVERRIGPHARVQPVPRRRERDRASVVRRLREQVQVEERRLVHVVARARERRSAVLAEPCVEHGDLRTEHAVVLRPERAPVGRVVGRVAGEDGRDQLVLHLARVARHDPRPRSAARGDRGERHHVVLDDRVGFELVEDLGQTIVGIHRAVDQRLPRRLQERLELHDGRLAELGRGLADEVLPELSGNLGLLGRRRQAHRGLLEALGLERSGERLLHDEHDTVPALLQHGADADAVVRGTERPFREEHHRLLVGHTRLHRSVRDAQSMGTARAHGTTQGLSILYGNAQLSLTSLYALLSRVGMSESVVKNDEGRSDG